jgi:hypothetical protein
MLIDVDCKNTNLTIYSHCYLYYTNRGHIVCDAPILTVSHKLGLNAVRPIEEGGRSCETAFERISYNGRTSVVRCILLLQSLFCILMILLIYFDIYCAH